MKSLTFYRKSKFLLCSICILYCCVVSCKKFITIDPPDNELTTPIVFTSDRSATSAISGLYSKMMADISSFANGGENSITYLIGLAADDFIDYETAADRFSFYVNSITPTNQVLLSSLWGQPYYYIYNANSILEGLAKSQGITETVKTQITGEAKFVRAFCYFYLVNLYGDVPLITSTDYTINEKKSRNSTEEIYNQITSDLKDAQSLLTDNYISGVERVRPNKGAATALLARIYLFREMFAEAEAAATYVINNSTQYALLADLNTVFLKNSSEAIWQLMPVLPGTNTNEGNLFILSDVPSYATLSTDLLNSFETGDNRKMAWTHDTVILSTSYQYPYKYKVKGMADLSEYSMVLRLAEQYLIRSEARAQQSNLAGAQDDLNTIRNRAGLINTTASSKEELLEAIFLERRIELFSEWGHRWFDMKRTGKISNIMTIATSQKGGTWKEYYELYPIPQSERDKDPSLSQNSGY